MSQLTPTEYLDNSDLLFNVAKSGPGELYILPQSRAVTIQIGRGDDAFAQEVSESVDFGIEIGRFLGGTAISRQVYADPKGTGDFTAG